MKDISEAQEFTQEERPRVCAYEPDAVYTEFGLNVSGKESAHRRLACRTVAHDEHQRAVAVLSVAPDVTTTKQPYVIM